MANPFMAAMGGTQGPQGGPMNFIQFMMQNRGQNGNQLLEKMMSSGKYNQQQLNQAQQMAKQMEGPLGALKGMFGFR